MARLKTDWILFLTILAMTGFGIVMVYSASSAVAELLYKVPPYYFVIRQIGFALVSFIILITLRARRVVSVWSLTLLGAGLGLLLVTKVQFFLCLLPVLVLTVAPPLLRTRRRPSRLASSLAVLVLPSIVLGAVSLWVVWGSSPQVYATAAAGYPNTEGLRTALAHGVGGVLSYALVTAATAGADFYIGGSTFSSFWGEFGWMDAPLMIASPLVNLLVDGILLLGTIAASCNLPNAGGCCFRHRREKALLKPAPRCWRSAVRAGRDWDRTAAGQNWCAGRAWAFRRSSLPIADLLFIGPISFVSALRALL